MIETVYKIWDVKWAFLGSLGYFHEHSLVLLRKRLSNRLRKKQVTNELFNLCKKVLDLDASKKKVKTCILITIL